MEYECNSSSGALRIKLKGEFTFADNEQFRGAVQVIFGSPLKEIALDFSSLEFIDSAALSMLLVLQESCTKKSKKLMIYNSFGRVKEVLEEMKFSKFIRIKY